MEGEAGGGKSAAPAVEGKTGGGGVTALAVEGEAGGGGATALVEENKTSGNRRQWWWRKSRKLNASYLLIICSGPGLLWCHVSPLHSSLFCCQDFCPFLS